MAETANRGGAGGVRGGGEPLPRGSRGDGSPREEQREVLGGRPPGEQSEFWRELKPIEQKFRPGALPEAYIANAPTDDDRFYAPLSETVGTRPLWISPSQNRWCDVLMCRGAGLVNRHYHPQQVFAYTISGKWGYLEHDWVATAGDWVYEAPGESHTLVAYECDEPMRVTFNVTGPLIWLDENGEPNGTFDVFDYIALVRRHYEKNGIGADYIDQLMR
jgi:2,4'-dihydroxyacetophenone dioxygenase